METAHTFRSFWHLMIRPTLHRLFSWRPDHVGPYVLVGLVVLVMGVLSGCNDNVTKPEDVFSDAATRVEEHLLPELLTESDGVLRNLLNIFAALPEICATPLAELGSFVSSLPALQRAQQQVGDTFKLNDDDGFWAITWRDVVLGSDAVQLAAGAETLSVNLTLTVHFRSQNLSTLRALPFTLASQHEVQTVGTAPDCATVTSDGFFLVQDAASGVWTLSWCAQGESKVFSGVITSSALTRVIRRRSDNAQSSVDTLLINNATTSVSFNETTAPADDKGIRFFVRPGELVRLRLRIGRSNSSLNAITREQIRIGSLQSLPDELDADDFRLASNLPLDPLGEPSFTPGVALGTFIWQDMTNNQCTPGAEDQWRLRLSTPASSTLFSGVVVAQDDDQDARLRATPVGACPAAPIEEDGTQLNYTCTLQDSTPSGYDICVTAGRRVGFNLEVNNVHDPGRVFLGAQNAAPPSPDPFSILFEIDLEEVQSAQMLQFSNGAVVLRGNNDEEGEVLLNPDQVSLDPLCRLANEPIQPRVRLTGTGEYSTVRFEGSEYILDNVEFTTTTVDSLGTSQRFPDRGEVELRTRLEDEDAEITADMTDILDRDTAVVSLIEVDLNVNDVTFRFPDQVVNLTIE